MFAEETDYGLIDAIMGRKLISKRQEIIKVGKFYINLAFTLLFIFKKYITKQYYKGTSINRCTLYLYNLYNKCTPYFIKKLCIIFSINFTVVSDSFALTSVKWLKAKNCHQRL